MQYEEITHPKMRCIAGSCPAIFKSIEESEDE